MLLLLLFRKISESKEHISVGFRKQNKPKQKQTNKTKHLAKFTKVVNCKDSTSESQ